MAWISSGELVKLMDNLAGSIYKETQTNDITHASRWAQGVQNMTGT